MGSEDMLPKIFIFIIFFFIDALRLILGALIVCSKREST